MKLLKCFNIDLEIFTYKFDKNFIIFNQSNHILKITFLSSINYIWSMSKLYFKLYI